MIPIPQFPTREFVAALYRSTEIANELATRAIETQRMLDAGLSLDGWVSAAIELIDDATGGSPGTRMLVLSNLATTVAFLAHMLGLTTGQPIDEIAQVCARRAREFAEGVAALCD